MMTISTLEELTDMSQLYHFIFKVFPDLERDEVMFISLSSRNKYLPEHMRQAGIKTGRKEMFNRHFLYGDKNKLYQGIQEYLISVDIIDATEPQNGRLYLGLKDFKSGSGHAVPLSTLVCYVNINPSSMITAAMNLQDDITEALRLLVFNQESANAYENLLRLKSRLNTSVQKARSRKELIDLDIDIEDVGRSTEAYHFLKERAEGSGIKTAGGFHYLIRKGDVKGQNLKKLVDDVYHKYCAEDGEAKINNNGMIPLPGTIQAGETTVTFMLGETPWTS